jgi:hypothetical protein
MSCSTERQLQIPAQADVHEVRVMPESKSTTSTGQTGMIAGNVLDGLPADHVAAHRCKA